MTISISLTPQAEERLKEQAAERGTDPNTLASQLVEQAVTRPSVDSVLAPFRQQVLESGMTDEELDDYLRDLLTEVRREHKAKSA